MTQDVAKEVILFMEKYNEHFSELSAFVSEKRAKVVADELVWLLDALSTEQRLIMEGNDLEAKRLAMFERLGIAGKKARQLIEECPPGLKAKLTLECTTMEKHVDYIKDVNADIIELIERKLSIQEKLIGKTRRAPQHATSSTYTGRGVKVTKHNTSGGFSSNI